MIFVFQFTSTRLRRYLRPKLRLNCDIKLVLDIAKSIHLMIRLISYVIELKITGLKQVNIFHY